MWVTPTRADQVPAVWAWTGRGRPRSGTGGKRREAEFHGIRRLQRVAMTAGPPHGGFTGDGADSGTCAAAADGRAGKTSRLFGGSLRPASSGVWRYEPGSAIDSRCKVAGFTRCLACPLRPTVQPLPSIPSPCQITAFQRTQCRCFQHQPRQRALLLQHGAVRGASARAGGLRAGAPPGAGGGSCTGAARCGRRGPPGSPCWCWRWCAWLAGASGLVP